MARPQKVYHRSWDNQPVPGLCRDRGNRRRVIAIGQRFTEPDERPADLQPRTDEGGTTRAGRAALGGDAAPVDRAAGAWPETSLALKQLTRSGSLDQLDKPGRAQSGRRRKECAGSMVPQGIGQGGGQMPMLFLAGGPGSLGERLSSLDPEVKVRKRPEVYRLGHVVIEPNAVLAAAFSVNSDHSASSLFPANARYSTSASLYAKPSAA
jgi:hypothetical protein